MGNKLVVEQSTQGRGLLKDINKYPVLLRAYKASCQGGKQHKWVERQEFPYLLRNLIFFNELWGFFESIDADSDLRISKAELAAAITREDFIGTDADKIFSQMDVSRGG